MSPFLSRPPRKRFWLILALAVGVFAFGRSQYEVPVLMYHRVELSDGLSSTTVSPRVFESQMEFLKIHGYRVLPLKELARRLKAGERLPVKTVAITFDDGTLDTIENAFPVLKKMGFPATVFMITDNIGKEGWLSEDDLRILDENGVSVGSHTVHHAFLPDHDRAVDEAEIRDSKKRLEEVLGHPVTLFSYPAGGFTPAIRQLVRDAGYEAAVTTNHGRQRHDAFALHRVKVPEAGGNLFNFWLKASGFAMAGHRRAQAVSSWD